MLICVLCRLMANVIGKVNENNKQLKKSNIISLFKYFIFCIANSTPITLLCEWFLLFYEVMLCTCRKYCEICLHNKAKKNERKFVGQFQLSFFSPFFSKLLRDCAS